MAWFDLSVCMQEQASGALQCPEPDQAQGQGRRHGKAKGQPLATPPQQLEVSQPSAEAQAQPPSQYSHKLQSL